MIWTNQCVSGCALHADAPPFSLSLISLSQPLPFTMAASSKRHHKSAIAAYLGNSAPLPVSDLPTSRDILKQCMLLREQNPKDEAAFTVPQMATEAASLAIPVWHRANANLALPPVCVEKPLLARRLEWKWKLLASIVSKRKVHRRTKAKFEAELDRVFDILTCQCPFLSCVESKCNEPDCETPHIRCTCPLASKIPHLELAFIRDQRQKVGTKGGMHIGKLDKEETARQTKAI